MSLTHAQIEGLLFYKDPDSLNIFGTSREDPSNPEGQFVAFGQRITVDHALENLFLAAPHLYQTISQQINAMQTLVDIIDRMPTNYVTPELNKLKKSFIEMQNACLLAQRVAQVGIDEVAKTIAANPSH